MKEEKRHDKYEQQKIASYRRWKTGSKRVVP